MRTPCVLCVISGLGLAACGGKTSGANSTDAASAADGGLDASTCRFSGFGAPTSYSTASAPWSMFVYSPMGGVPNVIVFEPSAFRSATFELFANRGDGSFVLAPFQGAMGYFGNAISADFDGDGLADIAGLSLGSDGGVLQIDRNIGGGAFSPQLTTYAAPQLSGHLAAGDFEGNGHPDIAMAGVTLFPRPDGIGIASAGLDVFFNNGQGSLASPVVYPDSQGYLLERIAAADFDGNGSLDLGLFPGGIFLNSGGGAFGTELPLPTLPGDAADSPSQYWAVGDFNRDGKSDLVASLESNEVAVFLAVGGGSFALPVTYATSATPSIVAVGDFNGDSAPDVAVLIAGQTGASFVGLYLNQGDGTLAAEAKLVVSPYASALSAADFNGDGVTDLAVANDGRLAQDGEVVSSFTVVLSQCR